MQKNPIVSIIIVSYNTIDLTLQAIKSVVDKAGLDNFEIIVVDNASMDGSADAIEAEFPHCTVLRLNENIGFGRANNKGVKYSSGRYILLLNPDTITLDSAVGKLVNFASMYPNARIWGGKTLFEDGTLNPFSCWRFTSILSLILGTLGLSRIFPNSKFMNPEAYGGWKRDRVREVQIVTGCFFLIERSFWNELGGFDPTFFMYAEEADLCYRARQLGAKPMVTPIAQIVHLGAASDNVIGPKYVRLLTGKMTFIRKHWPRSSIFIAKHLLIAHTLGRLCFFRLMSSIFRRSKMRNSYDAWLYIWKAREQWLAGYPSFNA